MQLTAAAGTPPAEHAARRPAGAAGAAAADADVRLTYLYSKGGFVTRFGIFLLVILCIVSSSLNAQVLENGRKYYIRGSFGYGGQSLGDINDLITSQEQILRSLDIPVQWEIFGGAFDYGGEVGIRITSGISLGLGISLQRNDVNNQYSDITGNISDHFQLGIVDFMGNLTVWIPQSHGAFASINAGFGYGEMARSTSLVIIGAPNESFSISTEADGIGIVGGVSIGYQAEFASQLLLFGKVSYRYRNLGRFEGTSTSAELGTSSGYVRDVSDVPVDFDFSGFCIAVGIGASIGKNM
jgi:hypothetical protein